MKIQVSIQSEVLKCLVKFFWTYSHLYYETNVFAYIVDYIVRMTSQSVAQL